MSDLSDIETNNCPKFIGGIMHVKWNPKTKDCYDMNDIFLGKGEIILGVLHIKGINQIEVQR